MKITAVKRPYTLTFLSSGHTYPLTSEDAQRLLDEYPARASERTVILPATAGGGPAFIVDKEQR